MVKFAGYKPLFVRKVIKISGKVLSAAVLLLIILPLAGSLLLDIPAVQNFVVQKATRALSERLETRVEIGRVDLGIFSKVKVYDLYVEDYQRDTLLYISHLDAFITGFGIGGGGVELSHGRIERARLYLRETPEGEMNIKQVVNRISNPNRERKGNFKLRLRRASIGDMEFRLERLQPRNPAYGIDFGRMRLYNLTADVDDFTIDGQSIYTTIRSLSAHERSGFRLDHLSGKFYMTGGCLGFQDVALRTPASSVQIPYISLVGDSWLEYKDFVGQVRIDGALHRTRIASDDVAYFSPRLRDWHLTLSEIDIDLAGTVADFRGDIRSMQINEEGHLVGSASIQGLPDIASTRFDLRIDRLTTTAAEAERLARNIARKELPAGTVQLIDRAGEIALTGNFTGLLSDFNAHLTATTAVGEATANLQIRPTKGRLRAVRGDVATRDLRLGELIGHPDLVGGATLSAWIDGVVGRGTADAAVVGNIARLELNGYRYDSLRLDGRLRNREFDGRITARDANLDFDFLGMVDFNDTIPHYDFTMELRHADLRRLNINCRDSLSQLSARLIAKAGGRSLDDLNGRIEVQDGRYRYNDKEVRCDNLTITGKNSASSKHISLRSDFADIDFRSRTDYRTVFDYLRRAAWNYLPALNEAKQKAAAAPRPVALADDYSVLSLAIRDINPVTDAVSDGLLVAPGSSMLLMFNPASDRLSLKLSSEYIERRRMLATRLVVNARNQGDSLLLFASAEDLYAGALHFPQFDLSGGACQGNMQLSAGFTDTLHHATAMLGVRAEVAPEPGPNGRVIELRILPSHLKRGDKTWRIAARRIELDTARVKIDRFVVRSSDQQMRVDGIASRSRADSLTLTLQNFDLSPFAQFAGRLGYSVEGYTNGQASMKSVLRGSEVMADIRIDSLSVNEIPSPPLRLTSRWDFARHRAGVVVSNRTKGDTLIRGFYDPERVRYYARLKVDSLDLGLLDPVLQGVISSTSGVADVDLELQGARREARLTGGIRARNLRTTVDFTQVTYTLPEAVLAVENNRLQTRGAELFDPEGNRGSLDFTLNLNHLSNIAYELRLSPERMLVLDTDHEDNDFFYGRLFASGLARIAGNKGNVKMEIAAATEDNSTFFMPLSSKTNISYADFVVFEKPAEEAVDDVEQRKRLFEQRRKRTRATAASRMDISLSLDVRPNVEAELMIAGNAVRARGEGTLNLQIAPRSNLFEMYGDYTLSEGSYDFSLQNIINKHFTIQSGSTIQWTGSPMDAMLDIDALYKLKASLSPLLQSTVSSESNNVGDRSVPVECVIHLGDRLTNPAITFDVRLPGADPETQAVVANAFYTPEDVDKQFLYLMLFNSFYADANSNSNLGSSVSAATGFDLLSNMLSTMLPANMLLRYRPKSELSGEEVDFGVSKSLVNDRLYVEVEGNYLIDNKQAVDNGSVSNFMGEAYITYLIDPAGTLKVKAFTQTIDRFDENQGQQETGIGVYFKEDFDNFRNLRQRIKERFTNRKRQERRAARRAEREAERAREGGERPAVAADSLAAGLDKTKEMITNDNK